MTPKHRLKCHHFIYSIFLVGLMLSAGCSGKDPAAMLADATDNNVKRLSRMYTVFQMRNAMEGPKNADELKEFILSQTPDRLARVGIDASKVDEIFVSERDGEDLIVRYGTKLNGANASIPVVFESVGLDGSRRVGFSNAYTIEVADDAEYEQLLAGDSDNEVFDDFRDAE